ncbi:MAG TPA: hypothetical protein VK453_00285 [Micromonosporaceae bacterium]|nr:hypothetical protein [Micromonosporaceae bacterium]
MNRARPWQIARLLFRTHLPFLLLAWLGFAVFVAVVVAVISLFRPITISGWDGASGVVRWAAAGYGAYLTGRLLPVFIAHGQTRRDFMIQTSVFAAVAVAAYAALATIGYALEGLLYRAVDWPQRFQEDRIFTASDQVLPIFITHAVMLLGWMIAGAFLAAAFYRLDGGGLVAIPVAILLVATASLAVGYNSLPFVGAFIQRLDAPVIATAVLAAASILAGAGLTWGLVRDVPIKTRTS